MTLRRGGGPREVTLWGNGGLQRIQLDGGGARVEPAEGRERKFRQGGREIFAGYDGRGWRGGYLRVETKDRGSWRFGETGDRGR